MSGRPQFQPSFSAVSFSFDKPPLSVHPHPPRHDPNSHRYLTTAEMLETAHLRNVTVEGESCTPYIGRSAGGALLPQEQGEQESNVGCFTAMTLRAKNQTFVLKDTLARLVTMRKS